MQKNVSMYMLTAALAVLSFAACNKDDVITSDRQKPVIELDSPTGVYTVKTGRELTISPTYGYAKDALIVWSIDGCIVGRDAQLTYTAEEEGEVYVALSVSNRYGTAEEELRIDVVGLEFPAITLAGAENGYQILAGSELELKPVVSKVSIPTSYRWSVDGNTVSEEKDYTFSSDEKGTYALKFETGNEDGSDSVEFTVQVCTADELPFGWTFDRTEYNLSIGRSIRLVPQDIENAFEVTYTWAVAQPGEGEPRTVQEGEDPRFVFTPTQEGLHTLTVTAESEYIGQRSQTLTVNVCPKEGTYRRTASDASRAECTEVFELVPAPGQFVGQITTGTSAEAACAAALKVFSAGTGYISLGGFGGYVVVGFDHSIDNSGDYDLAVRGNAFSNSSEPGIVWVMQDENGDGKPNDTWYELKGSEYGKPETQQDYAVTYYRPQTAGQPVAWTDNRGGSGSIVLNPKYPSWIEAESYTLRGTRLAARNEDTSGNGTYWENRDYDWGYADNYSKIDMLTHDGYNYFRISDAVGFDGQPADLKYIDFVKVQVGLNAQSGWLGEISTEVCGFKDYNLAK